MFPLHERAVYNLSLGDVCRPIQIDVKFGRSAAAGQPSILSFRLPHDTMLGCSLWSADQRKRRTERCASGGIAQLPSTTAS